MVPGYTSANFQQCDIAVMHLSSTARLWQRLVQLPPTTKMSRAFRPQRVCGRDTSRANDESQVTSCTGK